MMKRIANTVGKLNRGKRACAVLLIGAATGIVLPGQTFTTLFSFDGTDGGNPFAGLVQATDGDFYGTTVSGGTNYEGTVFKITPGGTLTTLHSFCPESGCADGEFPAAGLVQATNGDLYGTTELGGANSGGTIFKITLSGALTTLYSFCAVSGCADGQGPGAALIQGFSGDLYGTTIAGGAHGFGTVFKITPDGTLTTIYSFCALAGCTDGQYPYGALVQTGDGDFYGTTSDGGGPNAPFNGTVFKITPNGVLTTLYNFCSQSGCTDGGFPLAGLVQTANGDFYGTTQEGGAYCAPYGCGTVFRMTPSGALTTLYSFCSQSGCVDGANPDDALIQATDGNLYGTTVGDVGLIAKAYGTVFRITTEGELTTLYNFCSQSGCTDGSNPQAGLIQATNGDFYGTAGESGAYNSWGTVFSESVGLGQFVKTLPTFGQVGKAVRILGTDLTGATSVKFNGVAAVFEVVSSSEIATTVPAGAATGTVQVVIPRGTLSSNLPFRVLP
jgi:uncharacterized repeat protein (TIGR03803 family)